MPDQPTTETLVETVREGWRGTSLPDDAITGRISNADAALDALDARIRELEAALRGVLPFVRVPPSDPPLLPDEITRARAALAQTDGEPE